MKLWKQYKERRCGAKYLHPHYGELTCTRKAGHELQNKGLRPWMHEAGIMNMHNRNKEPFEWPARKIGPHR